jgi:hypothetical protein
MTIIPSFHNKIRVSCVEQFFEFWYDRKRTTGLRLPGARPNQTKAATVALARNPTA